MSAILSQREYMEKVRQAVTERREDVELVPIGYRASDKDMGYRSWLRHSGQPSTPETLRIANEMIYGAKRKQRPADSGPVQMCFWKAETARSMATQ